jgi:hypothetical protein
LAVPQAPVTTPSDLGNRSSDFPCLSGVQRLVAGLLLSREVGELLVGERRRNDALTVTRGKLTGEAACGEMSRNLAGWASVGTARWSQMVRARSSAATSGASFLVMSPQQP